MKEFMKKIEEHPIKEVAVFIGGVIAGSALRSMHGESVLTDKQKEDVFIRRAEEDTPLDEGINHGSEEKEQP